jgi:ubiquitin C-terminal hydrolase
MNYEQYNNKGLSGLSNLGNTCFINSTMQILSHTYELNIFLDNEKYKNKLKKVVDTVLLLEWDNLRKLLWNKNCLISPGKFIKTIQKIANIKNKDIFTGYSQNDLPEFLLFIIDSFHNSLSREIKMTITGNPENNTDLVAIKCFEMIKNMYSKEYSEIWNLFYGIHVSEITNLETGKQINITPEPYLMIDLPIPSNNKNPNLLDCFNKYVEGEVLEGENGLYDETTGKKINIRKNIKFWSFPTILIISLKRFNNFSQKNQILVDFPLNNLNLSEYMIGYKKESYIYDLYAVCNHSGSVMGGHYTSFIKNSNGNWYHFNDQQVTQINDLNSIITSKAYCLFYRKKNFN